MIHGKKWSVNIGDYISISLWASLYKIISKVLSRSLRNGLHGRICFLWGVFVEGKQILDAFLVANKIVEDHSKSCKEDWGFLMRLNPRWVSKVVGLELAVTILNWKPRKWFLVSRDGKWKNPFPNLIHVSDWCA